jgi:RNA polymerase sigma-70 factor (ECF subfamily)
MDKTGASMEDGVTDDQRVEEALHGNVDAFGGLIKKYERPIFNLMARTAGGLEEAADLSQEAFLKAYEKLHTYHGNNQFFSWLYAVSLNLARDFLRKKKRGAGIFRESDGSDRFREPRVPDALQGDFEEEMKHIYKTLETLPLDYREALILRYRQDLPVKEVAAGLGISVSGAKMRIHRGLEQLRHKIRNSSDEPIQKP